MVFYEEARQTWYRPIDTVYSFCVSQISNDDLFRNEQTFCNSLYNAFQIETYFCYYMSNRHSNKYFKVTMISSISGIVTKNLPVLKTINSRNTDQYSKW